jgi:hypothetical protein
VIQLVVQTRANVSGSSTLDGKGEAALGAHGCDRQNHRAVNALQEKHRGALAFARRDITPPCGHLSGDEQANAIL